MRDQRLKINSRNLRTNATKEERQLWYLFLNKLPIRFWRQKVIGDYIVDFCCPKAMIIIELDGSQHYEKANQIKDKERDQKLSAMGYTVLRYTNREIHDEFRGVCQDILNHLQLPNYE